MAKGTLIILSLAISLAGCASGTLNYVPPAHLDALPPNVKIIKKSRDVVWNESVPELSKRYFAINNLDKASGLINLSFTGDPESYMDCGHIVSFVNNLAGQRTYDFPAARGAQDFEILNSQGLFRANRTMSLQGRVNLIFEEVGPAETKVTATTRYVVQRHVTIRSFGGDLAANAIETVSFNTAGSAAFAPAGTSMATECVANGMLEKQILSAVQ